MKWVLFGNCILIVLIRWKTKDSGSGSVTFQQAQRLKIISDLNTWDMMVKRIILHFLSITFTMFSKGRGIFNINIWLIFKIIIWIWANLFELKGIWLIEYIYILNISEPLWKKWGICFRILYFQEKRSRPVPYSLILPFSQMYYLDTFDDKLNHTTQSFVDKTIIRTVFEPTSKPCSLGN